MDDAKVSEIELLPEYCQKLYDFNGAIQQTDYSIYAVLDDAVEDFIRRVRTIDGWYDTIEEALRDATDYLEELYADEDADDYDITVQEKIVEDLTARRNNMGELYLSAADCLTKAKNDAEELQNITKHQSMLLTSSVQEGIIFLESTYSHLLNYKQSK